MKYFDFATSKEILYINLVNMICGLVDFLKFKENIIVKKCKKQAIKSKGKTNKCVIILNAPSVKKQNLSVLSSYDLIFVNRGFMHPEYKKLQPKYHIICDPKFLTGVWPISWLDEIMDMVPNITIVLPVEWHNKLPLNTLMHKKVNICWIRLREKAFSPFVAGYAMQFLMDLNYSTIYFTGCEANGLGHELVRKTSHFYGVNAENQYKNYNDYIVDFYTYFCNYNYFKVVARKAKHRGIDIVNLTIGGCLDMFHRENYPGLNICNDSNNNTSVNN